MTSVVPHEDKPPVGKALNVTSLGLQIAPDLSFEQWAEETGNFLHLANMTPLYVGDAMVYGFAHFKEEQVSALLTDIGKTKHTVQNWISIARAIPVERRVEGLEAGHYDAIRGIKSRDGKPLTGRQDQMIEQAAREGWTVAKTREMAADARDKAQGKLIDVPDDREEADDDTPVMDTGAFGEGLEAERAERELGDTTDGFDQISKIASQIGRLTPDLRHRLWRMCINPDDASLIHDLFPQSPSHVEPEASASLAPCEAPAKAAPEISKPPAAVPVGGGSLGYENVEMPECLRRAEEAI